LGVFAAGFSLQRDFATLDPAVVSAYWQHTRVPYRAGYSFCVDVRRQGSMQGSECNWLEHPTGEQQLTGRSVAQINSRLFELVGTSFCFFTLHLQVSQLFKVVYQQSVGLRSFGVRLLCKAFGVKIRLSFCTCKRIQTQDFGCRRSHSTQGGWVSHSWPTKWISRF
jgi:hypothetical protein